LVWVRKLATTTVRLSACLDLRSFSRFFSSRVKKKASVPYHSLVTLPLLPSMPPHPLSRSYDLAGDDVRLADMQPLIQPALLVSEVPLTPEAKRTITTARQESADIIDGVDRDRLLVIVGPCSIHSPSSLPFFFSMIFWEHK
jgi:hypothetical protein